MPIASDEYQTPKKYIKAAHEVMGSIDLDPACSDLNYERLSKYINLHYNKEHNGLTISWAGCKTIWLNEPYSKPNLTLWTNKLIEELNLSIDKQAINLVPSYTGERWYQKALSYSSAICLPDHRIKHLLNGRIADAPRFSSTFFYFGYNNARFLEIFGDFWRIWTDNASS